MSGFASASPDATRLVPVLSKATALPSAEMRGLSQLPLHPVVVDTLVWEARVMMSPAAGIDRSVTKIWLPAPGLVYVDPAPDRPRMFVAADFQATNRPS